MCGCKECDHTLPSIPQTSITLHVAYCFMCVSIEPDQPLDFLCASCPIPAPQPSTPMPKHPLCGCKGCDTLDPPLPYPSIPPSNAMAQPSIRIHDHISPRHDLDAKTLSILIAMPFRQYPQAPAPGHVRVGIAPLLQFRTHLL
jgi:hypothetical protein